MEATLIEFTQWVGGKEKIIAQFEKFEDLPSHLIKHFNDEVDSEILFQEEKWRIIEINKDLRAHGKGMHVKVRLEKQS